MAFAYPIRPAVEDDYPGMSAVHQHSFNSGPQSEEVRRLSLGVVDFERMLAAFDGPTIVGTAGAYSFQMSVPGAAAPVAGVTWVGVMPSHRRRGILSALMRRQLADIRERGEATAALWASEAGIYGRYGYGRASWHTTLTVHRGEGALAPWAPADQRLRLRIAEPDAARAELAKVYDTVLPDRPGMFGRNEAWWDRAIADPPERRAGACPLRCVIAEDADGPRGYVLYSAQERWDAATFLADGALQVRELIAADPAATAALWADLLSRDLVTTFRAELRPADDPLLHLLADPRLARPQISDGLWVRLVDVGAALAQRRYACPADVVIELSDRDCPWNSGRWRLAAGADGVGGAAGFGAACERTTDPADLTMPTAALGAAYLGGARLGAMAAAGLITEHRPGALAALSAAMSWDPAPWCPMIF